MKYIEPEDVATWRSKHPLVPQTYRIDDEYVCFTNAENLVKANPELRYAEGMARGKGDKSKNAWGHHAWCVDKDGNIVDPYFEWKFPGEVIEYREEELLD